MGTQYTQSHTHPCTCTAHTCVHTCATHSHRYRHICIYILTHMRTHSNIHSHTHTTHRCANARSRRAGVCRTRGVVGSRQYGPARGGVESTGPRRTWQVACRKPPAPATDSQRTPRAPQLQRRRDHPGSSCKFLLRARSPVSWLPHPEAPLHVPGQPSHPTRSSATPKLPHASRERRRRPRRWRRPGGVAGARRRLPLLPPPRQEPLQGSLAALMYYSLGWPRRFMESPRRRRLVFARQLLVWRFQVF